MMQLPETIKLGFVTAKGEKTEITNATVGKVFRKDFELVITANGKPL